MMHGLSFLATLKTAAIAFSDYPTKQLCKVDGRLLRNGMPALQAILLAKSDFPVPGGPYKRAPDGAERSLEYPE